MKIAIQIDRDAALRIGEDRHGWKILDVPAAELTQAEREEVLTWHYYRASGSPEGADYCLPADGCPPDEEKRKTMGTYNRTWYRIGRVEGIEGLREVLRQIRAAETAVLAERHNTMVQCSRELESWLAGTGPEICLPSGIHLSDLPEDLVHQIEERRRADGEKHTAEVRARAAEAAAREAEAEARKRKAEARKMAQLAEVVARLGNDNQRARHAEGLLPAREGWQLLEAEELARFEGLEHVREGADLTEDPDCGDEYCEKCERTAEEISKISAEEFDRLAEIRRRLPAGAQTELRRETARCNCGRARTARTYVRATWTVGDYAIARDLPLSDEIETETDD